MPYLKSRRLRLIGGPNGSGKSTITQELRSRYDIGIYLNPDEIEQELVETGNYDLLKLGLKGNDTERFKAFLSGHSLSRKARRNGYPIELVLSRGSITDFSKGQSAYQAALITDYLRHELIRTGKKLTFESVMSHESKVDILKSARDQGYKTYLYYVCTASPTINMERVNLRVKKGGHNVPKEKIERRYYKSLALLKKAAKSTYRTFVWDNSGTHPELVLEIFEGKEITFLTKKIPHWVERNLL